MSPFAKRAAVLFSLLINWAVSEAYGPIVHHSRFAPVPFYYSWGYPGPVIVFHPAPTQPQGRENAPQAPEESYPVAEARIDTSGNIVNIIQDDEFSSKVDEERACCRRIKVGFTKNHANKAYDLHSYMFTYFQREAGIVNERAHYTSEDGRFAVSYCGDSWWVQSVDVRGECIGWAHSGWQTHQCVEDIEYTWRYYVPTVDSFLEAHKGLSVWCKD